MTASFHQIPDGFSPRPVPDSARQFILPVGGRDNSTATPDSTFPIPAGSIVAPGSPFELLDSGHTFRDGVALSFLIILLCSLAALVGAIFALVKAVL